MKTLSWRPVLSNLAEALGEIKTLNWRLYYLTFGVLPEGFPWKGKEEEAYKEHLEQEERRMPFSEITLFHRLEHVYHHLNWAWNCRRTEEDKVWNFSERSAARWTKLPMGKEFSGLWPENRNIRECYDDLSRKELGVTPVRMAIHVAQRKLGILCYLAAKEAGEEWERPEGLNPEIGSKALTEMGFARRMHRIYEALNNAWNNRNGKTLSPVNDLFPSIFATGCHNMWRK